MKVCNNCGNADDCYYHICCKCERNLKSKSDKFDRMFKMLLDSRGGDDNHLVTDLLRIAREE